MVATAAGIATDKMRLLRANLPRSREKNLANHRWAEEELQKLMREFELSREVAMEKVKELASTWAEMLM